MRPAQRDSEIYNLGVLGILGWKTKSKNRPAQLDSPANAGSILKNRPLCPCCPLVFKNRLAQRHSGIYKLGIGLMRPIRLIGQKPEMKNTPAQLDSMSNLGHCPKNLLCPFGGWLSGMLCWPHGQQIKNSPAQAGSKNSNLVLPLCLAGCQASPAMRDNSVIKAVQRDSGISKLGVLSGYTKFNTFFYNYLKINEFFKLFYWPSIVFCLNTGYIHISKIIILISLKLEQAVEG